MNFLSKYGKGERNDTIERMFPDAPDQKHLKHRNQSTKQAALTSVVCGGLDGVTVE